MFRRPIFFPILGFTSRSLLVTAVGNKLLYWAGESQTMLILNLFVLFWTVEVGFGKLLMLSVLHRHGTRMPEVLYPNDVYPESWPKALGQLTNEGKRQEYELGKYIRRTYDTLIGDKYFANVTYYRSTDFDRTLMSAELVSAGIFTPQGDDIWNDQLPWQPIPIHTIPSATDYLLNYGSLCPEFKRLYEKAKKVPPISTFIEKHQKVFDHLSNYAGMKVSFDNYVQIHDAVSRELVRNKTEPHWIMEVWEEVATMFTQAFELTVPNRQLQKLKGGPFLKELITNCKAKAAGTFDQNLMMYSAHDTTLVVFLYSLGVFNGLPPPYASAMLMEFHHTETSSTHYKDFAIKLLYRNNSKADPFPLLIPGCGAVLCPFDTFLKVVAPIIPEDIVKECKVFAIESEISNFNILGIIAIGLVLLEILGLIALFCATRCRKYKAGFQPLSNDID